MSMKDDRVTAKYRVIADSEGSRYRFFRDVSNIPLSPSDRCCDDRGILLRFEEVVE